MIKKKKKRLNLDPPGGSFTLMEFTGKLFSSMSHCVWELDVVPTIQAVPPSAKMYRLHTSKALLQPLQLKFTQICAVSNWVNNATNDLVLH